MKIRLASSASVVRAVGRDQAASPRPWSRMRAQVEAGAVVAELDADFVAFVRERDDDRADRVLARAPAAPRAPRCRARRSCAAGARTRRSCGRARRGRFRSSRRRCRGAPACRSPWRPGARRGRGDRTGPRTRPCACAAGRPAGRASGAPARPARLRSTPPMRCRRALHRGHVVDRLGHHARQFLEAREAVELERIERLRRGLARPRGARSICVSACSSMSRSWRRRRSRFSVRSRSEPLIWPTSDLEARARDADLAGLVDQAVEQRRAHAHRRLRSPLAALDAA